ncbi:MAG: hypothetical protein ACTSQY_00875 [Candidatus Odinarchaeia archaeon]
MIEQIEFEVTDLEGNHLRTEWTYEGTLPHINCGEKAKPTGRSKTIIIK